MKTEATIQEILKVQQQTIADAAFLSFEEKIRILIRMQAVAAEIFPDPDWTVWTIPAELFEVGVKQ